MSESQRVTRTLQVAEKAVLGFMLVSSAAVALIAIVAVIARVITTMTAETLTVAAMSLENPAAEAIAEAPSVTAASFDSASVTVSGLSTSPRMLLAMADALGTVGMICLCLVVAWLCVCLFAGRPFTKTATWGIGGAAIAVMAGGLLSQAVRANAHFEVVYELDLEAVGLSSFAMSIDLAPLGWGLALAVIAGAFEIGQRMQHDTERLV